MDTQNNVPGINNNSTPPAGNDVPKSPLKNKKPLIISAIVLVVVVLVVFLAWWFVVQKNEKAATGVNSTLSNASPTKRLAEIEAKIPDLDKQIVKLQYQAGHTDASKKSEYDAIVKQYEALMAEEDNLRAEYAQIQADLDAKLIANVNKVDVDAVYNKLCSGSVGITYKNADYSSALTLKLAGLKVEDLAGNLISGVYPDNQIPEALQYLGLKLNQAGKIDDGIKIYKCAAEKYYDLMAMYRMAQIYKNGTDSFKTQFPNAVITSNIGIDYKQAYFWVLSAIYAESIEKTGLLDTSTQLGWNTIAMLDDLQETGKISDSDMKSIKSDVTKFVAKRYSSPTSATPAQTPSGSVLVLDSKPYTDIKNGFSIIPPKGWNMENSGKSNSYVMFTNPNSPSNATEVIEVAPDPVSKDSLSAHVANMVSVFKMAFPEFNLSEDKDVSLNGVNAHLISFSFSDTRSNITMRMTLVLTLKNGKAYHAGSIIDDSNWAAEKSVIEASLLSLKFN